MQQMQIKLDSIETVQESKVVVETPKSPMARLYHKNIVKRFSSIEIPYKSEPIWHETSLTMTRDRSPSHKIPNAIRFGQMKSKEFIALNLSKDIRNNNRGVGFAKATRPEHFIKRLNLEFPSSANYNLIRFLDQQQQTEAQKIPEKTKFSFHQTQSTLRGVTIPGFNTYTKSYLDHSKHKTYQPENTIQNPGPGHYNHSFQNKRKSCSYSIRKTLKRFNEKINNHPGVASYNLIPAERQPLSINTKTTIPKSMRTYLTKFEEYPSPHDYNISRFLESGH